MAGPSLIVQNGGHGPQTQLQSHINPISCVLLASDGRSLLSADKGPNSQICVWDCKTLELKRTIKCPHSDAGVSALELTPDNNFLLSLAANGGSSETQDVALWDLSCPYPTARNRTIVPAGDPQQCICINAEEPTEVKTAQQKWLTAMTGILRVLRRKPSQKRIPRPSVMIYRVVFQALLGSLQDVCYEFLPPAFLCKIPKKNLLHPWASF
jgi:hypothetical protein